MLNQSFSKIVGNILEKKINIKQLANDIKKGNAMIHKEKSHQMNKFINSPKRTSSSFSKRFTYESSREEGRNNSLPRLSMHKQNLLMKCYNIVEKYNIKTERNKLNN
jgi:hypothetical protein